MRSAEVVVRYQDLVIGGFRLDGKRLELLLVGYFENKELRFAGKVHQGFPGALTATGPTKTGQQKGALVSKTQSAPDR
jgi:hypothetical protein